jgi:hypothetical protein
MKDEAGERDGEHPDNVDGAEAVVGWHGERKPVKTPELQRICDSGHGFFSQRGCSRKET